MAKSKKELAKAEGNVIAERPDYINEDSSRGQEGVGVEDLTIPRLGLIQDLSPQRKKTDPAYIEGAEEGMLFNTVTNELYGTSVEFVPCFMRKEFIIWKKQNAGGGFEGAFPTEAEAKAEFADQGYADDVDKKNNDECNHEINDTGNHFGLIVHEDGKLEEIVISMSKSKMKVHRQFNTIVKMAGGDRFSRIYRVSAAEDENSVGQTFFNLKIDSLGYATESAYKAGEKMYKAVSAGAKDVNRDPD